MKTTKHIITILSLAAAGFSNAGVGNYVEDLAPLTAPIVTPASDCPWSFGFEALYLEAESSDDFGFGYDNQEEEFGYRIELARELVNGWGIRGRYFHFEGTDDDSLGGEDGPDIESADLEVFKSFDLGKLQTELSLGVRYMTVEEVYTGFGFDTLDVDYEGWGPTAGIKLLYPVTNSLAVYLKGRASYVMGTEGSFGVDIDIDTWVLEAGAGLEYSFRLFGDCKTTLHAGYEIQDYRELAYGQGDAQLTGFVLGARLGF